MVSDLIALIGICMGFLLGVPIGYMMKKRSKLYQDKIPSKQPNKPEEKST